MATAPSPTTTRRGSPRIGGARIHVLAGLVLLGLAGVVHGGILGHGLFADDYFLLLRSARSGAGEIVVRDGLRALVEGPTLGPYWRPGWYLLHDAVHGLFGGGALPFMAVALGLHGLVGVVAYGVVYRLGGSAPAAFLAAAIHVTSGAHVEAVAWPAAAFNVLPVAALCLVAGGAFWEHLRHRRTAALVVGLAAFVLGLTFKEAPYHLVPAYALAVIVLARESRALRPFLRPRVVLPGLLLVGLAAYHYLALSPSGEGGPPATGIPLRIAGVLAGTVGLHEAPDLVRIAFALVFVALGLLPGTRPATRFLVGWAVLATLPYSLVVEASRFRYLVVAPAAGALMLACRDLLAGRARLAVASILAAVLVFTGIIQGDAARQRYRDLGRTCATAREHLARTALPGRGPLRVDVVPPALEHALAPILALDRGLEREIEEVGPWLRRPPFLLHLEPAFGALPSDAGVLTWDPGASAYAPRTVAEIVGRAIPLPAFALVGRYRVFPSRDEARRALLERGIDPRHTAALTRAPGFPSHDRPPGRIVDRDLRGLADVTLRVHCDHHALLVLHHVLDLHGVQARVLVDGSPTELLPANGPFAAIPLAPGRHTVRIRLE